MPKTEEIVSEEKEGKVIPFDRKTVKEEVEIEAKESTEIKDDIIELIKSELRKQRIKTIDYTKIEQVKKDIEIYKKEGVA